MPRSRKRHHSRSRSRSRSRSLSQDKTYDRHKRNDSYEKDGKRRRVDEIDSPPHKRSLSSENNTTGNEVHRIQDVDEHIANFDNGLETGSTSSDENNKSDPIENVSSEKMIIMDEDKKNECKMAEDSSFREENESDSDDAIVVTDSDSSKWESKEDKKENFVTSNVEKFAVGSDNDTVDNKLKSRLAEDATSKNENVITDKHKDEEIHVKTPGSDSDDAMIASDSDCLKLEFKEDKKENMSTPKKPLTSKQIQKKLESEKKKQQKQKEREERERQRQEEKAKLLTEKQKNKQQKEAERQKLVEQKQKEKEMKEEQKRKEREEKEQKRKEREEQEAQKRKEKELEKLKKQQEIEEKNKEKQREEEKKQKTAALFVGFFKKSDGEEKEKKAEKVNSNFMPFEVKSDMRLPPVRSPLCSEKNKKLSWLIENQDENTSYLKELKSGEVMIGKTPKTWPYEDPEDEVTIVDEDKILGETIYEDTSTIHKTKAKFLFFHDNRRPAYFGTWRKKSKFIRPRRPFGEDTGLFNYEEDSDDDWEEEEQGESLDASAGEEDKEGDNAEDDYEVDNEFFVPHGHLSEDEIDDEENARLSPESLKQKLKLLKDEFDEEIKSKTHKLKPRSIGCIWYSKEGDNVEDAIQRYLQPFAMIVKGRIEIKKRSEIFATSPEKKKLKIVQELPTEHIPHFIKIVHGNVNKKKVVIEQFLTYMANKGLNVEVKKINLSRYLKHIAIYKKCKENGPLKNKFSWFVNEDINKKYNVNLELLA